MISPNNVLSKLAFYILPYLVLIFTWSHIPNYFNDFWKFVVAPTLFTKGVIVSATQIDAINGRSFNTKIKYTDYKGVEHDVDAAISADEYGTVHLYDTFLIRYNKANPSMATSKGSAELFVKLLFSLFVIGWVLYITVKLFLTLKSQVFKT
jgi:hypothetical protein